MNQVFYHYATAISIVWFNLTKFMFQIILQIKYLPRAQDHRPYV